MDNQEAGPSSQSVEPDLLEVLKNYYAKLPKYQQDYFRHHIKVQENKFPLENLFHQIRLCKECFLPNGAKDVKHFSVEPIVCSRWHDAGKNDCSYSTRCRYAFVQHLFTDHKLVDLTTKYKAGTDAAFKARKVLCRDCGKYGMDPFDHLAEYAEHSVCYVAEEDINAPMSDTEYNKLLPGEFAVEKVLDKAFHDGKLGYSHSWVDWKGPNSWTPIMKSNFLHLIMAFEEEKSKEEKKREKRVPARKVAPLQARNLGYVNESNNEVLHAVLSITLMSKLADRLVVEYAVPVDDDATSSQQVLIKVDVLSFVKDNKNNLKLFFELINECFAEYLPAIEGNVSNINHLSGESFKHLNLYTPPPGPPQPPQGLTTTIEVAEPENESEMISEPEPGTLSPPVQVEPNGAQSLANQMPSTSSQLPLPSGLSDDLSTLETAVPMDVSFGVGPRTFAPMSREQLEQRINAFLDNPAHSHVSIFGTEVNEDGSQSLVLRLKNISNTDTFMDTSPGASSSHPTSIQPSGSGSSPNYGSTALSPLSMASPSCLINETNEAEQPRQQQPTNNIQCQGIDQQSQHQRQ